MAHFSLVACFAILVATAVAQDMYDEGRFAHINVDEVIANQRILTSFIKCFLDQGPCTSDARDMKSKCDIDLILKNGDIFISFYKIHIV